MEKRLFVAMIQMGCRDYQINVVEADSPESVEAIIKSHPKAAKITSRGVVIKEIQLDDSGFFVALNVLGK